MPEYDSAAFVPPAPVARVTLSHEGSSNSVDSVPMLLDTGADVTLVPAHAVGALAAETVQDTYTLEGFDGTLVTAKATELSLHFLGRVFRGRFLVLDQQVGIMGRNVLNHFSLLLDGPKAEWHES